MPQNMTATFREYMSLERRRSGEPEISIAEYQRWLQLKRILNRHLQPGVLDAHEDRRGDDLGTELRIAHQRLTDLVDDAAVHEPEVTRVCGNLHPIARVDQFVKHPRSVT